MREFGKIYQNQDTKIIIWKLQDKRHTRRVFRKYIWKLKSQKTKNKQVEIELERFKKKCMIEAVEKAYRGKKMEKEDINEQHGGLKE